jgi:hypothetical protein
VTDDVKADLPSTRMTKHPTSESEGEPGSSSRAALPVSRKISYP